ncbi:MAG: aminodeoxychorismate synthase component I [Bacteroidetes bacterium]|nr:MAG: aminodeoxychorismate synthase component I [Bacteroidota bacterium]PTM14291.1 MAG: aminodeoxychorismate synthase component I [Bacteroidota bacterium]
MNTIPALSQRLNLWGQQRKPFLLLADFELEQVQTFALADLDPAELRYCFHHQTNWPFSGMQPPVPLQWDASFIPPATYQAAFATVQTGLQRGDSFLTNLTFPTAIHTNWSLADIYEQTRSRYKLWWKDHFVIFSPEIFVQIRGGKIFSNPMKGTAPGYLPASSLLADAKEQAEHATIVDLIRNDLSQVAKGVQVDQYRYLEKLTTHQGSLWQTSSLISGQLPVNFHTQLGDILLRLLPAGSISGAPKPETLRIIREAEGQKRGFYTGIAALWDGYELDSCVLIRFLEQTDEGLRYWSGGGITAYSKWQEEYTELKEKVYLPIEAVVGVV